MMSPISAWRGETMPEKFVLLCFLAVDCVLSTHPITPQKFYLILSAKILVCVSIFLLDTSTLVFC